MRVNTPPPRGEPASGSDVTGNTCASSCGSTASQASGPTGRSAARRRESRLSPFPSVSDGLSSFAASSRLASLSSRHSATDVSALDIAGAVTTINSETSSMASRDTATSHPKSEIGPRPGLPRNLAFASLQQQTPTPTPTPEPTATPTPPVSPFKRGVIRIGRFLQPVLGDSRRAKPEPSPIVDAPRPKKPSFTERTKSLGDELREKALSARDHMAKRSR
jgi:hypothetical protein